MICDTCKLETYSTSEEIIDGLKVHRCPVCLCRPIDRHEHDGYMEYINEKYKDYELIAYDENGHNTLLDLPRIEEETLQ